MNQKPNMPRNGPQSRCFGVDEYQKMLDQPRKQKPCKQRRAARAKVDPLSAIEGTPMPYSSLHRSR
jgi:hypothetical protein